MPVPGKRNVSSMCITLDNGGILLVDCGEGTQHHLKVCTMAKSSKIDVIFLTHLHGDHCFGIFGLIFTLALLGRTKTLYIVAPEGAEAMISTVLHFSGGGWNDENYPLRFIEIPHSKFDAREVVTIEDLGIGVSVKAVPLIHRIQCWGYVFQESDKDGKLDVEKAVALGVPKGPLLRILKEGNEVTLENGTIIKPSEVLGEATRGRMVAILQDTMDSSHALETCRGADLVIHEATFEKALKEEALEKGHSTTDMAAQFAVDCEAKALALTHFSSRYVEHSKSEGDPTLMLQAEAQEVFSGPVIIAKDFLALDSNFKPLPGLQVSRSPWHRDEMLHELAEAPATTSVDEKE